MGVIEIFPDRDQLVGAVVEQIVRLTAEKTAANRMFTVALSGGSTPRPVYALLASEPFNKRVDWSRVHIFWGD